MLESGTEFEIQAVPLIWGGLQAEIRHAKDACESRQHTITHDKHLPEHFEQPLQLRAAFTVSKSAK